MSRKMIFDHPMNEWKWVGRFLDYFPVITGTCIVCGHGKCLNWMHEACYAWTHVIIGKPGGLHGVDTTRINTTRINTTRCILFIKEHPGLAEALG